MQNAHLRLAKEDQKRQPFKLNFSARALAAIKPPASGRTTVYDAATPGLAFVVTDRNARSFCFFRRVNGRPVRIKLGGVELTVEQARKAAQKAVGDAVMGVDPIDRRRKERAAQASLGDLLANFIEKHAKLHKRTWEDDQKQIDRYLTDAWLKRRLSSIGQDDIRALHAKVGKDAPYAANRLLALLSAAYRKGGKLVEGMSNPAAGIQKFKEQSRDRFIQPGELPAFFAALEDEQTDAMMRDFFKLALLSGARRSNVMAMRFDEVDTAGKTWRIPPEKSKNATVMIVPLSDDAMSIITRRRDEVEGDYVFPGRRDNPHLLEHKTAWKHLLKRAGIKNLRLHDLRRSLGSYMAMTGASLPLIGKALGHKNQATTQIYARLNIDPVRLGVEAAAAAIAAASKPAGEGKEETK